MIPAKPLVVAAAALLASATLVPRDAAVSAAADTVTINPAVRYQTMRGWGASISFLRDMNYVSQATVDQIIDESVNDLGLTFLRIGYGMLIEPFNDNGNANSINWAGFHDKSTVDRDVARGMGRFNALVLANGEPPAYLLDKDWEFSAPSWMNDSEFSENATANILYFRDQHGIVVNFNSIDNEPGFFDPYTPERQRSIIKVMGPMFQANGLPTKIAYNEGISAENTWTFISALQGDSAVWPHVGLLNWHLYGTNDPFRSQIRDFGAARGIPTAMTEFSGAQINHLIDDLTLGGVSYWTRYFIADRGSAVAGASNYFVAPFDGTSFQRNIAYYQFRQFMKYVRPGAVRIDATSSHAAIQAFAFERAGTRVAVLVNSTGQAIDLTVQGLVPGRYGASHAVGSVYTEVGVQDIGTSMAVTVPGGGILTIYPVSGNQKPTAMDWRSAPAFLTLPASSITLSASAADTEREALSYTWSVKSQPASAAASIASPTSPTTGATGLSVAGTYVFTVTIRDTAGNAAARDVTVRAYAGNQPPVIAEGHRYYKQEWIIQPTSTATYGPLFITAIDLEGDPITTSFSVVSQPAGAQASFSGSTVSGMTAAGTYTFRFTASDPTQTVFRDFTRTVVSSTAPPSGSGSGRRRPPTAEPIGQAVPRTGPTASPAPGTGEIRTSARTWTASAHWIKQMLTDLSTTNSLTGTGDDWRRIEFTDADADGLLDSVTLETMSGDVWIFTIVADTSGLHAAGRRP